MQVPGEGPSAIDRAHTAAGADPEAEEWLRQIDKHAKGLQRLRRVMRRVPSDPRCHVCYSPFGGPGGAVMRPLGRRPSRKNPNLCSTCVEDAPPVGLVDDCGVLFGDVRGYTALAESRSPAETAELMGRYYSVAGKAVIDHDGILDKLVGDEVMALFWPPVMPVPACAAMLDTARALLRGVGYGSPAGPWLPVGVGLDFGPVTVGNFGSDAARDFTALGDVVNTAARLQANAAGGEILMSEGVHAAIPGGVPGSVRRELTLKGKAAPTVAYATRVDIGPPAGRSRDG